MHVLIIDDSSLFHKILVETIGGTDAVPVACHNMAQGMAELKSKHFDFICVSMHLKDGDGLSFTRTIRKISEYKNTPIILFTSDDSREVYINALSSGVTEVFHKTDLPHLTNFIQRLSLQQQPIPGRILYVEDAQSQRELVVKLFTTRGLEVDSFSTAEDAWDAYLQHDYDLVVTDIVLEGNMTGKTLTNHIRRISGDKGDIPILALTGYDDVSRRIDLFYLGVTDYVIKPLVQEELLARVRNLIKGKQFHMEAVKQQRRAEKADKAKSEFISQMSHELRTPLNAILGFSQILELDSALQDEQKDNANEITKAGNHLLELINEILDIAKIESGHLELSLEGINILTLTKECFSLLSPIAEREEVTLSHGNLKGDILLADGIRLKQILLNLLSNAIKYNRQQGSVELRVSPSSDQCLRITISDTGHGIEQSQIKELFQPFNRLGSEKSDIEGTGIGLTISRRLIELMGGKIGVESTPGVGSQFWFELPIFDGNITTNTDLSLNKFDHNTAKNKAHNTVLYVDDNPVNLKLVSQILAKQKHIELLTSTDAKEGMRLASAHQLDLILLDISMPQIDGYQMMAMLKKDKTLAPIPVIAVTANAMPQDIERGKEAGFTDYLTKPLNIPHLVKTVNHYLASADNGAES